MGQTCRVSAFSRICRGKLALWGASAALVWGFTTAVASAQPSAKDAAVLVTKVKKVGASGDYDVSQYVPLYAGDNHLLLFGPGVSRLLSMLFPPGTVTQVRLTPADASTSAVSARAFVSIRPNVSGKVRVKLMFAGETAPDGRDGSRGALVTQWINARVYRRGLVRQVVAAPRVRVGEAFNVQFVGQQMAGAAMRGDDAVYDVQRVRVSDTAAEFAMVFRKCTTMKVGAWLLYDERVPWQEVVSGQAAFQGGAAVGLTASATEDGACEVPGAKVPSVVAGGGGDHAPDARNTPP